MQSVVKLVRRFGVERNGDDDGVGKEAQLVRGEGLGLFWILR
jgi:hypothetical protein